MAETIECEGVAVTRYSRGKGAGWGIQLTFDCGGYVTLTADQAVKVAKVINELIVEVEE